MMFSVVKRRRSDSRRYFYALTQAKLRRVSIGTRRYHNPLCRMTNDTRINSCAISFDALGIIIFRRNVSCRKVPLC